MTALYCANRIAREFELGKDDVRRITRHFVRQMDEGLQVENATMSQIPSYVTAVPDGTETGLYLAVDLGGTNLRVCSVELHGDTTCTVKQSKVMIPSDLMVATSLSELFRFIARNLRLFLEIHHPETLTDQAEKKIDSEEESQVEERSGNHLLLGFTFSFAFEQQALNKGSLLRWTKDFNIPDAVGQDICAVFQVEIDRLDLPVKVAALINDTVGTLLARSYISPGNTKTLLGAIFGTGTNGAYVERAHKINKLDPSIRLAGGDMVVNTEWGSFDNELSVLPTTPYDKAVDAESIHPGIQMFEKQISGMYLGEILRHAIVALLSQVAEGAHLSNPLLNQRLAIDASFLSMAAADVSPDFIVLRKQLKQQLDVDAGREIAEAVKILALAVGNRAARLAGIAIAGIVLESGRLGSLKDTGSGNSGQNATDEESGRRNEGKARWITIRSIWLAVKSIVGRWTRWMFSTKIVRNHDKDGDEVIDIGVDGSLIEFYPGFENLLRSSLRDIEGIGEAGDARIRIGIAKDGSGVGAALAARIAERDTLTH